MTICNVLNILPIDDDTAIVVEGSRELFHKGIGILDDTGKPHEVLSVGMDGIIDPEVVQNRTSLLIKGIFESTRIYV